MTLEWVVTAQLLRTAYSVTDDSFFAAGCLLFPASRDARLLATPASRWLLWLARWLLPLDLLALFEARRVEAWAFGRLEP